MVELYAFILSLGFNVSYFVFSYAVIMFMLIVGCALVRWCALTALVDEDLS